MESDVAYFLFLPPGAIPELLPLITSRKLSAVVSLGQVELDGSAQPI